MYWLLYQNVRCLIGKGVELILIGIKMQRLHPVRFVWNYLHSNFCPSFNFTICHLTPYHHTFSNTLGPIMAPKRKCRLVSEHGTILFTISNWWGITIFSSSSNHNKTSSGRVILGFCKTSSRFASYFEIEHISYPFLVQVK